MQSLLSTLQGFFTFVLECVVDIVDLITNTPLLLLSFVPGFIFAVVKVVKRITKR